MNNNKPLFTLPERILFGVIASLFVLVFVAIAHRFDDDRVMNPPKFEIPCQSDQVAAKRITGDHSWECVDADEYVAEYNRP